MIVYVDDIVIIGDDQNEIQKFFFFKGEIQKLKSHLNYEFEFKDLGVFRYFLEFKSHV